MLYHDTDVRSNTPTEHTNEMGSSEDAQAWWQALHADHTVPRVCTPQHSLGDTDGMQATVA